MEVFQQKQFPSNYDPDVVDVIDVMSFKQAELVGSSSLRSQLYAGDYDLQETVKVATIGEAARGLKEIVRRIFHSKGLYLGDIKCGRVPEWSVIDPEAEVVNGKITKYNAVESQRKLDELREQNIITADEYEEASRLLGNSVEEFLVAKKEIKFDVVRWKWEDIRDGEVELRDGRKMTLEEAIATPSLTKVDCVGWVGNQRYTEFSCIYSFYVKGKWVNPVKETIEVSLKNDILYYRETGNYFKYAKRIFAYVRYKKDAKTAERLTELFNSELGRLYQLSGDMKTLLYLVENAKSLDKERIRYELAGFRVRLGSIYSTETIAKIEPQLVAQLQRLAKLPPKSEAFVEKIETLTDTIDEGLNEDTEHELRSIGLLPTPSQYLP